MKVVVTRKGTNVFAKKKLPQGGERFYILILHYPDELMLKIGTTNNPERRLYELLGSYKVDITVCWVSPKYTKSTTIIAEDRVREMFKTFDNWEWIRLDRFIIPNDTKEVTFKIRKEYTIELNK